MIRSTGAAILLLSLATSPLLPQSGAGARVAGTVRSSATKSVLPGAVVSIPSLGAETTTDSLGRFTLTNLASGARSLEVRAVGYAPLVADLTLRANDSLQLDVTVDPTAQTLARVTTTASAPRLSRALLNDFEARRQLGAGRFVTQAVLDSASGRRLTEVVLAKIPGLRIDWGTRELVSGRGPGPSGKCHVRVILDGAPIGRASLDGFDPTQIEAIEYYTPAQTPSRFKSNENTSCGTIVLWQRS